MPTSTRLIVILLSFLLGENTLAQKEANIWYFGENVGLNFNTSPPSLLTDGTLVTQEGCASIADQMGNLLFYTDGTTVWNRSHGVMLNGNGLLGDNSASQSAVIIPQPGNDSLYFLFTVSGHTSGNRGYNYSLINMRRDAGFGGVVLKNVGLLNPALSGPECIGATLHQNKRDIWVLLKKHNSDSFYAYLISPSGLNLSPVKSAAGPTIVSNYYMKFSPRGNLFCLTEFWDPWLMTFDQKTGKVSSGFKITSSDFTYDPAWSPNSRFLYLGRDRVLQFDVLAGTPSDIQASGIEIGMGGDPSARWARQLGPNGKIYIANHGKKTMDVIHRPNIRAPGCDYRVDDITFTGSGECRRGLPTFMQSYFKQINFQPLQLCLGDTTFFKVSGDLQAIDSVVWNFGDPSSGTLNHGLGFMPWHIYPDTGTYWVCAISYDSSGFIDTSCVPITILQEPQILLPPDTILCMGDVLHLSPVFSSEFSWTWSNNSTDSMLPVSNSGLYWVESQNPCGSSRDSIWVLFHNSPSFDLGPDKVLCEGDTQVLAVGTSPELSYHWSNGDTNSNITVTQNGTYWVEVSNACGTFYDSLTISFESAPLAILNQEDTTICIGDELWLKHQNEGENWQWSTGSATNEIRINQPGLFWLRVDNFCGVDVDSVLVNFENCCALGVPNAFSPNEDGVNDAFSIINDYCLIRDFALTIFNRYGEVVFESRDPKDQWDGTKGGKDLELGVYVYQLQYRLEQPFSPQALKALPQIQTGNITLLR